MNACHEKKRFTSNQLFEFVKTLEENKMRYMRTKTSDQKSDRRISFLRVTAGSGFGQKKVSNPTLGSGSYDQIRSRVEQNLNVLILELSEKPR